MKKLAVLISGRGSNLRSLINAVQQDDFPAKIALVISDKPGARGLAFANEGGIQTLVVNRGEHTTKASFEATMDSALREHGIDLVCLAGFMRLLSPQFVRAWENRIINIHPSLLPSFKGVDVHERVLESGVRLTGCTVHFVVAEMDSGPIIIQAAVPVLRGDTPMGLSARVLEQEHRIYPEAVRLIAEDRVKVNGMQVAIDQQAVPSGAFANPQPRDPVVGP